MSAPFIPFARPVVDEAMIAAVADTLRSRWLASGPQVAAFEAALSGYVGGRPVRTFTSATGAMPATGWNERFDRVSGVVHLPPGHRLLAGVGAGAAPGSGWERWGLWHVLGVLIVAAGAMVAGSWLPQWIEEPKCRKENNRVGSHYNEDADPSG